MRKIFVISCLLLLGAGTLLAQNHTIIVLSHNNHTIYELDPASGKILHEFQAPDQPHEAAISADGSTVYASIPLGATPMVEVLDGATFKEKAKIESDLFKKTPPAHRAAPAPAAAARGGRGGGGGLAPNALDATSLPHGLALNNSGTKLYIGVENADIPGIVVYDTKSGKVLRKIELLLQGGHYLQVQPGTDKLYYPHRNDNRVVVVDTKTDTIRKIIPVNGGPVGVAFAPNGEVWIHEDGDGSVTVIDSKSDEVSKVIQTGGKGAGRMAVSADGKWAASTHSDSADVAIINAATKEIAKTVHIGKGPGFPLFSPDSQKLYVLNSGEGDVCVIDLKQMNVTARYKVGTDPFGGGIRMTGKGASRNR